MSARDKGAVQRPDSNTNRRDKGAVEAHVAGGGGGAVVPVFMNHYRRRRVLN